MKKTTPTGGDVLSVAAQIKKTCYFYAIIVMMHIILIVLISMVFPKEIGFVPIVLLSQMSNGQDLFHHQVDMPELQYRRYYRVHEQLVGDQDNHVDDNYNNNNGIEHGLVYEIEHGNNLMLMFEKMKHWRIYAV